MTRIAIIADGHFDEGSRFEECVRLHRWIAADLVEREVDLVLYAGDIYDRRSTPVERLAVVDWLQSVTDHCPVVIVRGNHDPVRDLELLGAIDGQHTITVEEGAAVHVVGGVAVACMAWPRKAQLLAMAGPRAQEETSQLASEVLRDVLRGLGGVLALHDGPRVLLAHAMVSGSETSTGQPLVGCDLELGLADLALASADFVALGHIHKGQHWDHGGVPMVYPGSPRRTAFGELEAKGYVVAEVERGRATWQFVEAPATAMVLLSYWWSSDGMLVDAAGAQLHENDVPDVRGAEVRLRYEVASDQRDAARTVVAEVAVWLNAGAAVEVKVEEVVTATTRARAPEVAAAKTLPEKLRAYWAARGIELAEDRQQRVLGRLVELEEVA